MEKSNDKAMFFGSITASVTHEIQNVFAIIKETSGLMEDFLKMNQTSDLSDIENKLNTCLETIKKQAYRGVTYTSGLNSFAHTPDNIQSSINVAETIKKMIFIADRLFTQKGVDVSIIECNKSHSMITDPVLFQIIVFSCINCLIDTFQAPTAIILDLQTSDDQAVIKFSCHNKHLKYEEYKSRIIQSSLWIKIGDLCKQIDLKADIIKENPGILIRLK